MAHNNSAAPVIEAQGITKVFPGTVALAGVDFSLFPGRIHALIGENGAGKSTLVRILAGVEQPTSGRLLVDGRERRFESPRDAARAGVAIIHQELQRFPDLSVAENLFVGRRRAMRWGAIDTHAEESATRQVLARLNHPIDPRALVGRLPLGQQQIVEIARALLEDARVLMMDEPTSALTQSEIPVLFGVIRDLASHGVSIVYISHHLEELLDLADTVTVLRDGRLAGHDAAAGVDAVWIVERMTGRAPGAAMATPARDASGETLLSVRDLRLAARPGRSALDGVSLQVAAGEVVGVYGLMGAGRTELFESLMGVHADASGGIDLDGRRIDDLDTADRVQAGLAMVPEDRQAAGLVGTMSVRDNMTLSSLGVISRGGYLAPAAESQRASRFVSDLRIKTAGLDAPVSSLSGGNQQKVILARGLMCQPRVLLLDEPTRGVDVAAKADILGAMRRLAGDGLGVVFASSDLEEVRTAATRVLVMARGRIAAELGPAEATDAALAATASALPAGSVHARG